MAIATSYSAKNLKLSSLPDELNRKLLDEFGRTELPEFIRALDTLGNPELRKTKVLFNEDDVFGWANRIGNDILRDFGDSNELVYVTTLAGAVVWADILASELNFFDLYHDTMWVSSYENMESTGKVKIIKDLEYDIKDKHIILVEDIIDTGTTLSHLVKQLRRRQPSSISVVSMLTKKCCHDKSYDSAIFDNYYVGADVSGFVVGMGLDYNCKYRMVTYNNELVIAELTLI